MARRHRCDAGARCGLRDGGRRRTAAFNGNPALINEAKELLTHRAELNELTLRQLNQLLLNAAEAPMTNPDLVAARVEAETKQASTLNSFEFKLDGKPITANDIDNKLDQSADLAERRKFGKRRRNPARP